MKYILSLTALYIFKTGIYTKQFAKRQKLQIVYLPFILFLCLLPFTACGGGGGDGGGGEPATYTLTLTASGPGTVTRSPDKSIYSSGETVTITATPDAGKAFYRWAGSISVYNTVSTTVTMNSNKTISGEFISEDIYYVRSGSSGDGTKENPWGSIQTAINSVTAPARIFVAAETYNESITVKEGISLYGGFNADFNNRKYLTESDRSDDSYETILTSTTSGTSGGFDDPQTSFLCDGSTNAITAATVIEGFTINSGTSRHEAAVVCQGASGGPYSSPTIRYNTITGVGDGSNTQTSYGIYIEYGAPTISYNKITGNSTATIMAYGVLCDNAGSSMKIDHNYIYGGDDTTATEGAHGVYIINSSGAEPVIEHNTIIGGADNSHQSIGIYDSDSASVIRFNVIQAGSATSTSCSTSTLGVNCLHSKVYNNIIHGGRATSSGSYVGETTGVFTYDGSAKIYNNTICGGNGDDYTVGVYIWGGSSVSCVNNIIFCEEGAADSRGLQTLGGSPGEFKNNNIFDCGTLCMYPGTPLNDTALYEATLGSGASGNISIDLINNSGSYYFTDWDGSDNNIATMSDNNWHLTSGTPVNVLGGGLDLSATFTVDYDGVTRTTDTPTGMTNDNATGWSMGAFEKD